ncbi:MAG: hypothetical protein ABI175_27555 [Polyangiales bacterium]
MRASLRFVASMIVPLAHVACSSAAFDLAPADQGDAASTDTGGGGDDTGGGGTDTGGGDDTSEARDTSPPPPADGGGPDTAPPPPDAIGSDGISGEGGVTCASLPSGATDVYVDKKATGPSTGTAACPFKTIGEATTLSWSGSTVRTIHVAGGSPAFDYPETASVVVRANVKLLGAGPAATTISKGGSCPGGGSCVVLVEPGGILDGFNIPSGGGSSVVTNASTGGTLVPAVRNCVVTDATVGANIVIRGGADLGPNLTVTKSYGVPGVQSSGAGIIHVIGTTNAFDKNGTSGFVIDGAANLMFDGGSASGNGTHGLRLAGTGSYGVSNLQAIGNVSVGINVGSLGSIQLRKSTLIGNRIGLIFPQSATNNADLGTTTSAGGNVFAASTGTHTNTIAGVCLANVLRTITAEGNTWQACPPSQGSVTGCDLDGGTPYRDVYVSPGPTLPPAGPVTLGGCVTP